MKRIVSIIMSLLMVFLAASPSFAAEDKSNEKAIISFQSVIAREDGNYEFVTLKQISESEISETKVILVPFAEDVRIELEELASRYPLGRSVSAQLTKSESNYEWDSSSSFYANVDCHAIGEKRGNDKYWKLSYVDIDVVGASGTSGSYLGSGLYMTSQTISAATSGFSTSSNTGYISQIDTGYGSSSDRSWTYYAPSSWDYVHSSNYANIGANLYVDYRRGSSGTINTLQVQCFVVFS